MKVLIRVTVIVVAVLLVVGIGGSFALERWVNGKKGEAVAQLEKDLGRPVKAGPIDVRWLGGFGATITGLEIGADPRVPTETAPALRLEKARLRVGLLGALFSLGNRVRVHEVAMEGLTANVIRDKDGVTNWQRIQRRFERDDRPSKPIDAATERRLRGARIARAHVDDARVTMIDHGRGGARAEIADVDIDLRDVSLQAPFEAKVTAAVQAKQKNFDLQARFGATPAGLATSGEPPIPPLQKLVLKLDRTDLAPLGPFLASAGPAAMADLSEGVLTADFTADLGAAAPNGQGPTVAKGTLKLAGARIGEGERFDATLDADVLADAVAGNVTVNKLQVALAEMALEARGKLLDLLGAPKFEGFTLTSRGLDFDRLRRYYPTLTRDTGGVVLGGPFSVTASAGGDAGAQRFTARVDLTSASIEVPGKMRKPAGKPMSLEAEGRAEGETLRCDRMLFVMDDARITGSGVLSAPAGKRGARSFEANIEAEPFAIRKVAALMGPKTADGLPDARVGARVKAKGRLGRPDSMRIEVPSFSATSGSSQLAGSMTVENLDRPQVTFDGRSRYLDIDDFLPPQDRDKDKKAAAAKGPTPKATRPRAADDSLLAKVHGRAKLAVDSGVAKGITYQNLRADLTVDSGRARAHTLDVSAFGGKLSGGGSEIPLLGDDERFALKGTVAGMDIKQILTRFAEPAARVLEGRLDADLDVGGRGLTPDDLKRTLTGNLTGGLAGAQFLPASLLEPISSALARAVKIPALAAAIADGEKKLALLRDRNLGDLAGVVRFNSGVMELVKPLAARTPHGPLSLDGKVGLDGKADLTGTFALAPQTIAALTANKVALTEPLPVKLRLTGDITSPKVVPGELDQAAKVLALHFARNAATAVAPRVQEKARQVVEQSGIKERVEEKVPDRARQEAQKAREAAGRRLRGLFNR